jgi:hypothetical protein
MIKQSALRRYSLHSAFAGAANMLQRKRKSAFD